MPKIYYVGARLTDQSTRKLETHFDRFKVPYPKSPFHTSIIYSRVWFPYKASHEFPITLEPPFTIENFGKMTVLCFRSPEVAQRHIALRACGAGWDYPDFKSHITLGKEIDIPAPRFSIDLAYEYYGTWEEP